MKENGNRLTVAIIGAGGTAGSHIADKLLERDYDLLFVEEGEGIARLRKRGLQNTKLGEAVPKSDIVIMAVPDAKIGEISKSVVQMMEKDATLILPDPSAACAGELDLREDCTFVVAHPCHPPLFLEQETAEARRDFFGGIAKQDIVAALLHGKQTNFQRAKRVCIEMFGPVAKCHVITVDQMVILEPVAAEVAVGAAAYLMKEAFDEAVRHGVPKEAARTFMLGHIQILLALLFGETSHQISDAAKIAIKYGCNRVLRPDWKEIFKPEEVREIVDEMLHPEENI